MTMEGRGRRTGAPRARTVIFAMLMLTSVTASLAVNVEPRANYNGWRIIEVLLDRDGGDDNAAVDILKKLEEMEAPAYLEILRTRRDKGVAEVAASPEALEELRKKHKENTLRFSTTFQDLGKKLEMELPSLRAQALPDGEVTFDRYMDVDEILAYIEDLPNKYPDLVNLKKIGTSIENRPIYLVTMTRNIRTNGNKPIIFIDGGIHAREWISPAAAMYLIERLSESPNLTRGIEWQIMPLLNPDGYAYTWTHDRLWRKNRAQITRSCSGTDLNRNFGYHWGESGSSNSPCSSIYKGRQPFSEPESRALREAMVAVKDRIHAYITIHSYGQYILYPWGYTTVRDRFNEPQLQKSGEGMARAIKNNDGTIFSVGTAAKLLYPAAGASDDWAAGELKIPLVYTLELRDEGVGGFILPENLIIPAVTDAWLALNYLSKETLRKEGVKLDSTRKPHLPKNTQPQTTQDSTEEKPEESVESTTEGQSEESKFVETIGQLPAEPGESGSSFQIIPVNRVPLSPTGSASVATESGESGSSFQIIPVNRVPLSPTGSASVAATALTRPAQTPLIRPVHRKRYRSSEEGSSSEESSEESDEDKK
ncbi:carboxypeptidase B1-like [Macrobrachium nipponense]|uniref:carboxypeptidase B1-like n=1 Tax=Macrobrachium nipponense TaxID=159736 RepID=UPI0030C8B7B1